MMIEIKYLNSEVETKLVKLQKEFPLIREELPHYLELLQQYGEISRTEYHHGNIIKVSGTSFSLFYLFCQKSADLTTITIIDIREKAIELLKQEFQLEDSWDDSDVIYSIPQYDSPRKLIQVLELIKDGVFDTYELGFALGHRGKSKRYISRHGQYATHALVQLKLINKFGGGSKWTTQLTEDGKRITDAKDQHLKDRLLITAMLKYPPVLDIITAVSKGDDELDDGSIKKIAFPEEDYLSNTSDRRSQTMKAWIKWISQISGISIRLPGGVKQLSIPMLYADTQE